MEKNRELYNFLAERYDLRQQNPATHILISKEANLIKQFSSGRVLDIGCGTGRHLNFAENAIGLDISENMIGEARLKGKQLIQASIESLPIKTNSVETVWCFYGTLNLVDLEKASAEISKIVDFGGHLILSVISIMDIDKYRSSKENKIKKFRLEGKPVNMRLFDKKEIVEAFVKSGFKLVLFDSVFRIQKPRWGNFQKFSLFEKMKLSGEKLFPKKWGKVYLFVFKKM